MTRIHRLGILCVAAISTLAALLAGLYQASQAVPDFYEQALKLEPTVADEAGDQLEHQVVTFASDLEQRSEWRIVITDQQINGWLATDLVQKFPQLLPTQVRDPRVAFDDQLISFACRLNQDSVSTVLSMQLELFLTASPNEVGIRVRRVRAGWLPVPLTQILDQVTAAAQQSEVSLRWTQQDGDPVALIAFAVDKPQRTTDVILERLEVTSGELVVSGRAEDLVLGEQRPEAQSPRLATLIEDALSDHR